MGWKDTIVEETTEPSTPSSWKSTIEEEAQPSEDSILQTGLDMLSTAPQGVTTWADEIEAGARAALRAGGGERRPLGELFAEEEPKVTSRIAEARQRSPIATTIGEIGTGIGSSLIPGVGTVLGKGKFGGALSTISRGALEGLGLAEDKLGWEGATQSLIGAGAGTAGALASNVLKAATSQSPAQIRAGVLGARAGEFAEIGFKQREKLAQEMTDMGLFKSMKMKFDPKAGKWVSKGKSLEAVEKPIKDRIFDRLEDAFEETQKVKDITFGKFYGNSIDEGSLYKKLKDAAIDYADNVADDVTEGEKIAMEAVDTFYNNIRKRRERIGTYRGIDVGMLENEKQKLQGKVGKYGKDPLLAKIPDASELYQRMYTAINNQLKEEITDPEYARMNGLQTKFYTVLGDLKKSRAAEAASKRTVGLTELPQKIMQSPESQLQIARAAEVLNLPGIKQTQIPLKAITEEAPFAAQRFLFPTGTTQVPYASGREPQSIPSKIPRKSEEILKNKQAFLQQAAMNGEDVDALSEMLNNNPRKLPDVLKYLAMKNPTMFEDSDYNTIDGIMIDPEERAKAADDTSKRDDLNSLQKAKIINELNKTGKWIGE